MFNPDATLADYEEAIKNNKRVVVDFFAEWCGPCKMLGPILEEVSKSTEVPILKINVEKESDLAGRFNVRNIPTVIVLDNGVEVKRNVGLMNKEEVINFIS